MDRSHHSHPTTSERCNDEAIGEEKALVILSCHLLKESNLLDGEQLGE